ncbi:hypothetical protein CONCODRAFT_10949 [Conidiobolus coronatus NRRL 28638]|uniref:Galactose oxidase n=1 Tax=Conidiobolus coronatus (strain ATCC 28846 / CBS 209.66 / NRRL 28638) TaxID=796925 RepID=A0A137NWA3_CONC2|nr:hypothetical protein CONCODRAFT_10949 [Conidiobolus coronatus NRRL 28638]|eukprot:KXN67056.1 hypothetical protein CONCODRAFT_10949 [Conidiobolus coronatus NRRL 28638]
MGALYEEELMNNDIDEESWTSQILNDKELRFDSSFIAKPSYKNFPESAFSITIVNNNNNPILYVIGGLLYSKELKTQLITNYQFKYEFKTNTWSDLSQNTKSILQPVAYHKVIQADNSLILISGATQNYTKNGNFTNTVPTDNSTHIMISDIYKFDLSTEKWSLVNAKLNLGEEQYGRGQAEGLSLDIYNEKLISYMALKDMSSGQYNPKLATLDYKAKDWGWTWLDVNNDAGTDNSLALYDHHTLIINDQLLLFHGNSNQEKGNKMYAIDLKTNKFQGFANISGKYGQSVGSGLPTWEIILIVVICVVGVIIVLGALWFYFRYKKQIKPVEKNNQKMQEVWAASDVEAGVNYKGDTTLTFGNTLTSTGQTVTSTNDETMMSYECFQHEVDLNDMENIKAIAKV